VTLLVLMWVYVLYLAIGPGRQPPPDRLDDPTFARQAQLICDSAHDEVDEVLPAFLSDDPSVRADAITRANDLFATMLDDLEAIAPRGEDGDLVMKWLADWRTYLGDRQAYADALRVDPEARLLVTAKDQAQITEFIDAFAADNKVTACATPLDV
jgi:hypothetical protein